MRNEVDSRIEAEIDIVQGAVEADRIERSVLATLLERTDGDFDAFLRQPSEIRVHEMYGLLQAARNADMNDRPAGSEEWLAPLDGIAAPLPGRRDPVYAARANPEGRPASSQVLLVEALHSAAWMLTQADPTGLGNLAPEEYESIVDTVEQVLRELRKLRPAAPGPVAD